MRNDPVSLHEGRVFRAGGRLLQLAAQQGWL